MYFRPSVALRIAKSTLSAATLDHVIVPCQWETSIPRTGYAPPLAVSAPLDVASVLVIEPTTSTTARTRAGKRRRISQGYRPSRGEPVTARSRSPDAAAAGR